MPTVPACGELMQSRGQGLVTIAKFCIDEAGRVCPKMPTTGGNFWDLKVLQRRFSIEKLLFKGANYQNFPPAAGQNSAKSGVKECIFGSNWGLKIARPPPPPPPPYLPVHRARGLGSYPVGSLKDPLPATWHFLPAKKMPFLDFQ